jgi:hypothetical protein
MQEVFFFVVVVVGGQKSLTHENVAVPCEKEKQS